MKIIKLEVELSQNEINSIKDVIEDALEKEASDEDAIMLWDRLPVGIKLEAAKWGVSDTVVLDRIHDFITTYQDK